MWIYIKFREQGMSEYLYQVGAFVPGGDWHIDTEWGNHQDAARRVSFLNGGAYFG